MTPPHLTRPDPAEYAFYFARYVDLVPAGDIIAILEDQMVSTAALLAGLTEAQGGHRYAPAKWTLKEVVSHVADSERVFCYRALRFARGDSTPLPGFDQDSWVPEAACGQRTLVDIAEELRSVRAATLTFVRSLTDPMVLRGGTASDNPLTVRSLAYIIAGHELHHLRVLRERYLA
jgi:hypothetical protein